MPWFKVDDGLSDHPKVTRAGNAAMGLWVRAGSFCARHMTDGYISEAQALALGTKSQVRKLIEVGLWYEFDEGYVFHEWEERQPLRAEIEHRRKESRDRLREWRNKRHLRSIDGEG